MTSTLHKLAEERKSDKAAQVPFSLMATAYRRKRLIEGIMARDREVRLPKAAFGFLNTMLSIAPDVRAKWSNGKGLWCSRAAAIKIFTQSPYSRAAANNFHPDALSTCVQVAEQIMQLEEKQAAERAREDMATAAANAIRFATKPMFSGGAPAQRRHREPPQPEPTPMDEVPLTSSMRHRLKKDAAAYARGSSARHRLPLLDVGLSEAVLNQFGSEERRAIDQLVRVAGPGLHSDVVAREAQELLTHRWGGGG